MHRALVELHNSIAVAGSRDCTPATGVSLVLLVLIIVGEQWIAFDSVFME